MISNETKQIEEPQVTTLNLPIDLVKKFKKNLEPLAVSLLIKHHYGDSLLKDTQSEVLQTLYVAVKQKQLKSEKKSKTKHLYSILRKTDKL